MAGMDLIRKVTLERNKNYLAENFSEGDTVDVHVKVKEGEKERIQIFKGVVLKVQGSGMGRSFTVRKVSAGVGVERTFPLASPIVQKVEVKQYGKVRRAKLFYLRQLSGRAAKVESELAVKGKEREVRGKKKVKD